MASVSCASWLIEPYDIAPVANRLMIASTGSTSSIGDWRPGRLEAKQSAQRRAVPVLLVDEPCVLLENLVLAAASGVLQLEYRLGIEEVVLAVTAPLILAAGLELHGPGWARPERPRVPEAHFLRNDVDADAAHARGRVREVPVDERLAQPDRLEDLRAAIALQRRDPHLRHHLEDALVERLDVVRDRLVALDAVSIPCRIMSSIVSNATYGLTTPAP